YPPPNLSRLRNGLGAVDGYNLLRLIRAAASKAQTQDLELVLALEQRSATDGEPSNLEILRHLDEVAILISEGLARLAGGASPEELQRLLATIRDRESAGGAGGADQ